jgi:isopentenyl-diphosphate delta-isomerase type 1
MEKEYLDIVSEEDIVVGKETRKKVHEIGLWHRGVHVFLFNDKDEMLIQKRSANRTSSPSLLDCSVSEHVQAGENYLNAAIRGLKEELGIENVELRQLVKFKMNYGINDNEISVIYEGKIESQQINFDRVEIEEIFYMNMDEIKEKTQTDKSLFCNWFVQMMNWYFEKETRLTVLA